MKKIIIKANAISDHLYAPHPQKKHSKIACKLVVT